MRSGRIVIGVAFALAAAPASDSLGAQASPPASAPTSCFRCSPVAAQKLVRDYQFKQSLKDSADQGPELKALNGTLGDGVYAFGIGQGLELAKTGVTGHYTIELTFDFGDIESWQKILDFKNRNSDNGLYVYEGKLQFYDFGIGGEFQMGKSHRVRLERDQATKRVRGFLDDREVFQFVDTDDHAVFENQTAFFFVDDVGTGDEQAQGAVTRIRIWDTPGGVAAG